MALDDILKKIESEAEEQKRAIITTAEEEAAKKVDHAQRSIEEEAETLLEQRRRETEILVQRELAQAKMSGRNLLGRVKSEALKEVRKKLLQTFGKHIEKKYEKFCTNMIVRVSQSRDEEILMAPHEAKSLGEEFVKKLNKAQKTSFSYGGETEDIERGFFLRKGGMLVNVSFSSLLDEIFREHEKEVAEILFLEEEA